MNIKELLTSKEKLQLDRIKLTLQLKTKTSLLILIASNTSLLNSHFKKFLQETTSNIEEFETIDDKILDKIANDSSVDSGKIHLIDLFEREDYPLFDRLFDVL